MFEFPTMEVPVPTIQEAGLGELDSILQERQMLKAMKEDLENRIKQIDEEVGFKLDAANAKSVVWYDQLVIRRQGSKPRPTLDRVLLLEAGVTPQQLKEGTKYGEPGKPGITIRAIAENKAKQNDPYRDWPSNAVAPPDGIY